MCLTPVLSVAMLGQNRKTREHSAPLRGQLGSGQSLHRKGSGVGPSSGLCPSLSQTTPLVNSLLLGKSPCTLAVIIHTAVHFCPSGSPISLKKPESGRALGQSALFAGSCWILVPQVWGKEGGRGGLTQIWRLPAGAKQQDPAAGFKPNSNTLVGANFSLCHYFGLHCLTTG